MHLFLSFFIDVMISEIRGHRKSREEIRTRVWNISTACYPVLRVNNIMQITPFLNKTN